MKRIFFSPLLLLLILLTACQSNEIAESKTVDQNSIFQEYYVSYSEQTNYCIAKATFRHGGVNGTTLLLSDPSTVTFNGRKMDVDSNFISGAYYHVDLEGPMKARQPLRFKFIDYDGKKFQNYYKMNILKWKRLPKQVQKGSDLEIPVYKTGIVTNERVRIWLQDAHTTSTCSGNLVNGKLVISANDLKSHDGEVSVTITREYDENVLSTGGGGGNCTVSYEYEPFTVELK